MNTPKHRIAQLVAALAAGGVTAPATVSDPTSARDWIVLSCTVVIAVATAINHVFDPQMAKPMEPPK